MQRRICSKKYSMYISSRILLRTRVYQVTREEREKEKKQRNHFTLLYPSYKTIFTRIISNFFYTIMLSLPISFISNEYITRIMGQARPVCPFFLHSSSSSSRLYRNEEDFGRVENRWNNIYRDWPRAFEQFAVSEASGG